MPKIGLWKWCKVLSDLSYQCPRSASRSWESLQIASQAKAQRCLHPFTLEENPYGWREQEMLWSVLTLRRNQVCGCPGTMVLTEILCL